MAWLGLAWHESPGWMGDGIRGVIKKRTGAVGNPVCGREAPIPPTPVRMRKHKRSREKEVAWYIGHVPYVGTLKVFVESKLGMQM